ncbi:retroelement silencing factor 1 [Rhineura floridana]|uniref:retroelement silencing factor 1 n=1 Tax=Rhineura floridana TaxID=261503 RepID=UPI002AC80947|nr:retroelement silencing factor 1 [Rhineura floridana]
MDWNTRLPPISSFQTQNFQIQGPYLSQQFTAAGSQENASIQNPCTYPGNDKIMQQQSGTKNILANRQSFQKAILPKTSVHNTSVGSTQHLLSIPPISHGVLSAVAVHVASGMTQNSVLTKNVHISSPVTLRGNTVNPMQNTPKKTVNPITALESYSNQALQNCSNSMTTSVYQHNSKNDLSPKRRQTLMPYYHVNASAASQAGPSVPLKQPLNQYLNSQQNFSCLVFPLGQNTQSQTNGPSSSLTVATQSQHYTSDKVNPIQYAVPNHYDSRNAAQIFPQDITPPPYPVTPVQRSHGQFVLPQTITNISHENVQNHHSPMSDQSYNSYSAQHGQKHQSVPLIRETNEGGKAEYSVSGHRGENQLSNELAKSSVKVGKSLCNSVQTDAAVSANESLTLQTGRTLEKENLANGSGIFPENLKDKVTAESLALDAKQLLEMKKMLLKLKVDYKKRYNIYISSIQNKQTTDTFVHNQNPNISLPPFNTNQNPSLSLPQDAGQPILHDTTQNQSISPVSCSSYQVKDVTLSPLRANKHLLPILKNMLEGTIDEDMLYNTCTEKAEMHQNRHLAVKENSSSAPLPSIRDASENPLNNITGPSRLSSTTSIIDSTQEPLICTNNGLGYEQNSRSANNPLEKISTESGALFHHFKLKRNKGTVESVGQNFDGSLQSSVQNPAALNGSFLSRKEVVKEFSEQSQCSASAYPGLIQQTNTCLQKPEGNITGSSENGSDSCSSAFLPETAVQEAGIIQKPSIARTCSWEELKTSLALWRKKLPASFIGQLSKSTESAMGLSSSGNGVDGKTTQQTMENLPSTLIQNDQIKIESNETTLSPAPSFLEKRHDAISSNLLKSSEPQVAIVTPLIMTKENNKDEVQKKSPSLLEIMYPIIEEGSVYSLQEHISVVPDADEGGGVTVRSPSDTGITVKKVDSDMHRKVTTSKEESMTVKAEMNADCLRSVPQKEVESHKRGLDLLEPGDTAAAVPNDTVLEISSVCTLVQGDAFYNSQIASIFNTSPLKSSMKNDTSSEEHMPYHQHKEQESGLLKRECEINMGASAVSLPSEDSLSNATTEKLLEDLSSLGMPQSGKSSDKIKVSASEEAKSNHMCEGTSLSGEKRSQNVSYVGIHSADLASDIEALPINKENLFRSSITHEACTIKKDSVPGYIPTEEIQAYSGNNVEAPVISLNNQLTELSEEFPYGIGDSKGFKKAESNDSMTKPNRKEDEENTQICEETPTQIKIEILNSQQMKEMFPGHSQSSSNIPKNCEDDLLISDIKDNLREEKRNHSQTDQAVHYDSRNTTAETDGKHTYCCLRGWLASGYEMKPCLCTLPEDIASEQKVGVCSQSESIFKDWVKASGNDKADCRPNDQLKTSTLHPVSNSVLLEDQSNKILNKTFGRTKTDQVNKCKPSKIDPEIVPLPLLEKIDSQKPKRTNKQAMEELSLHAASHTLKSETVEIKIHYQSCGRENFSAEQAQCNSSIKDLNVLAARTLSRTDSCIKQRTLRERLVAKSKADSRKRRIEIKHSACYERYKIKRDSSETHMIKGPTLNKGLTRKMAVERKHKTLGIQHSDAINPSDLSSVKINSQHKSIQHSQEHLNRKWKKIDFEKNYGYKSVVKNNEPSHSEHTQHNKESSKRINLGVNLEKYAYSKEKKNAGQCRSSHLETPQKPRGHASNILKTPSPGKGAVLDTHKRDKWPERSLSDKKTCFHRRAGKLSISLQREQKKNYLNRVAFKRTTQKIICLTNLESNSWHVKSSSISALSEDQQNGSLPSQQPEVEKRQMLEFKMCPEILFGKSVSEEPISDAKKLPENDRTPITAVKSKREDWLNYSSVKRRKTEDNEAPVNDDIPLAAAIKLLDEPVKDSNATFQTYRKMHLEKKSRSLDSTPLN